MPAPRTQWVTKLHARLAGLGRPATAFVSQPEPRSIGHFAKGRQLTTGNYLFAGYLVEASPGQSLWTIEPPSNAFAEEIHGFLWLDDLAAVGDASARALAQGWIEEWIELYGTGKGPGWAPDLTGRRLIRWINHAIFLMSGKSEFGNGFFQALGRQTRFLSRRWSSTTPGLPRIEALTGLIYAGLSLTGMEQYVPTAIAALGKSCEQHLDSDGGLASRNPEELLEVFTLLNWAALALREAGRTPAPAHEAAIARAAPVLRALRHSDGGLARFHGGGRGLEGRLDEALATSGVKSDGGLDISMGFTRQVAGRTSVIMDAAPPPQGVPSYNAHASTLAFELTSGRRPLIVSCGSGAAFGEEWRRAGRATPSHSTLSLEGYSSSRLGERRLMSGRARELLTDTPCEVLTERRHTDTALRQQASHDGYRTTHGLVHVRTLELHLDGRGLAGEDLLVALNDNDRGRLSATMGHEGLPFAIRFHLHPEADASVDMAGAAVSIALKSGEIWVFRHDGHARLAIEPSVYLERGRLKPRGAEQIVLFGRATTDTTRVRWSLAKAQETPLSVRDIQRDDPLNTD
ncbi:MAG: heparinase II/III family protein [Rhodobacteraceae bacterium]|nr:heparinase II/III family protein [Paracoccaceae bacterium]